MTPLDALQTALAAEHAALHVYGALGARTSISATPGLYAELVAAHDAHRDLRDELTERIREAGAEPVAAEPAYELPAPLATPDDQLGRVNAVEGVFIGASNELGAFESGVAARAFGLTWSIALGGMMTVLVATSFAWLLPSLRRVDSFDDVRPPAPDRTVDHGACA